MLCTVCVIVHGREKWVAHTDTLCSIIGEKIEQCQTKCQKTSDTGLMLEASEEATHSCCKSGGNHISTTSLSVISKVLSRTNPDATIKKPSTCHTERERRCSDVRRLEQHRRMLPWYPMAYMAFPRKIGQPTQSCTLFMKPVSASVLT